MRTKSLRIVVQEATERRKRFQSLANLNTKGAINVNGPGGPGDVILGGSPAALLRRKSTKVWGQRLWRSNQMNSALEVSSLVD